MDIKALLLGNLSERMAQLGVRNLTELAKMSGVSQSVLSRFASGVHASISLDNIDKLARALKVKPAALLSETGVTPADHRTQQVLQAMETLPEWGKDVVAASAQAMLESTSAKPPGSH